MNLINRLLVLYLVALVSGACATTQFVSVWQDPDVAFGALNGEKIAAFLISEDEGYRRSVEDALAGELTARGADGIAGYTLLSGESAQDQATAERTLGEADVDAVITMRVVSEDVVTSTTPATWRTIPTYRRWGGYWVRSWETVYEPGQISQNTVVMVETLIYNLESRELIWAGISKTTNPGEVDSFIRKLASAVDDAIVESGGLRGR